MIGLALLKYLEDNQLGKIDKDLFFQKLGLGAKGVYIVDTGETNERGRMRSYGFTLYSRGDSDVDGYKRLSKIVDFLNDSYEVCSLPPVAAVASKEYKNITIMPMSTIASVGVDTGGRVIFSATGLIYY